MILPAPRIGAGDWSKEDKLSPLNKYLFDNSDIITFHNYEYRLGMDHRVAALKRYERPIARRDGVRWLPEPGRSTVT